MNCARMNSIYIKYTYIALYLGRGAVSFFSFLILKMKCCCLCLWLNHPAPSWLNFASSGDRGTELGWQETRNGAAAPAWGWVPQATCPLPEVAGVGFGSVVLDSVVSGPGEGGLCRLLSSCTFSSAALQCCINARKGE